MSLLSKTETTLFLNAPYNAFLIEEMKKVGGKWNSSKKKWGFDYQNKAIVIEKIGQWLDLKTDADMEDLVDIEVTFPEGASILTDSILLFGRVILSGRGRDSGTTLGDGVILLQGESYIRGSVKNWFPTFRAKTKLLIRDVPRKFATFNPTPQLDFWAYPDKKPQIPIVIIEKETEKSRIEKRINALKAELSELEETLKTM